MVRTSCFYIVVLLLIGLVACDSFEDLPQEADLDSWELFSQQPGMASDSVYSLLADSKGNVWAGTWSKGLMKYDGNSWVTYTTVDGLPSNEITAIEEYWDGSIWIGTLEGLAVYDGQKISHFKLFGDLWITEIKRSTTGDVWIGTQYAGLIEWMGDKDYEQHFNEFVPGINTINSIDQRSSDGSIWAGTNAGLYVIDGDDEKFYTSASGLVSDTVTAVFCDGFNDVWIGDYYSLHITRIDYEVSRLSLFNGSKLVAVQSIVQDWTGNIWFGTIGSGVTKYDGVAMRTYSVSDGLPGNVITDISVDPFGSIWFASSDHGITKYTPSGTD